MEVVKIRLQAQQHSLADPLEAPKYRNAGHAVYAIVREEGFGALYRGVSLTALRQATNQGAFFVGSCMCGVGVLVGFVTSSRVGVGWTSLSRVESSHYPTEPTKGEQKIWRIEIRESRTGELTNPLTCRCELHGVPGAEEVRAPDAARADRPAVVPAHAHWPHLGRDGPVLECAD